MSVDAKQLRAGDRVYNGSLKGIVLALGPSTVVLVWDGSAAVDMISTASPLWLFLDVRKFPSESTRKFPPESTRP